MFCSIGVEELTCTPVTDEAIVERIEEDYAKKQNAGARIEKEDLKK
jgi:hypothetical protein